MTKNTIIRVDENNLVMLEIDPESHTGQGGILDTVSGNFYPFSSVVSPTHSSIVRFDDTNVVLIKLDPDTHDSSAIIMDEVSGNVYPISSGPEKLRMEIGNILADGTLRNEPKRLRAPDYYIPTGDKVTVTGCPWGTWSTITDTANPNRGGYFFRAYDADKNPCGSLPSSGFFNGNITDRALPAGTEYVRLCVQRAGSNIPDDWASLITDTFMINDVEYEVND